MQTDSFRVEYGDGIGFRVVCNVQAGLEKEKVCGSYSQRADVVLMRCGADPWLCSVCVAPSECLVDRTCVDDNQTNVCEYAARSPETVGSVMGNARFRQTH